MTPNQKAFLDTIATSEGTRNIGDSGYNVLVGSTPANPLLFTSYADHPRIYNKALKSTAAGRYQILEHIYDYYKSYLRLPDFSPASQDAIAIHLITECGALKNIEAGAFRAAVAECAREWASLPGAGYGQRENTMVYLSDTFVKAGGTLVVS